MNSKYCATYEPTAVYVVETWLSEDISDAEISISDHSIISLDRNRHGGGIGIYVQNNVMVNTPLYSPSGLEFLCVIKPASSALVYCIILPVHLDLFLNPYIFTCLKLMSTPFLILYC